MGRRLGRRRSIQARFGAQRRRDRRAAGRQGRADLCHQDQAPGLAAGARSRNPGRGRDRRGHRSGRSAAGDNLRSRARAQARFDRAPVRIGHRSRRAGRSPLRPAQQGGTRLSADLERTPAQARPRPSRLRPQDHRRDGISSSGQRGVARTGGRDTRRGGSRRRRGPPDAGRDPQATDLAGPVCALSGTRRHRSVSTLRCATSAACSEKAGTGTCS